MEMEDHGPSLRPGLVIDREHLLAWAEDGVEFPGTGMTYGDLHEWAMIVDLVNEASATTAPTSQPTDMANSLSDLTETSGHDDDKVPDCFDGPSYRYSLGRSYANSRHPRDMDNCTVFKQFKRLPRHIRSQIWKPAAQTAKAGSPMLFHFTYKKMALNAGTQYSQLSQSLFDHVNIIPPGDQLVRDVRELMRYTHDGDSILTLIPSLHMANATLGIRNVLRCCPEARTLLLRNPRLSSCFKFYWITSYGQINLGTMRPFCYDTDWIRLDGLDYPFGSSKLGFGRPGDQGVRCTPDLGRIQHFAFPYDSAPEDDYVAEPVMQLDVLHWLPSLKSVGFYRPCFAIEAAMVPHCDSVITKSQRLFLNAVPGPPPPYVHKFDMNDNTFRVAMLRLERLVRVVRGIGRDKLFHENQQQGRRPPFTALQFCFLVHADSQEALDLMKFREDGSHLDEVSCDW